MYQLHALHSIAWYRIHTAYSLWLHSLNITCTVKLQYCRKILNHCLQIQVNRSHLRIKHLLSHLVTYGINGTIIPQWAFGDSKVWTEGLLLIPLILGKFSHKPSALELALLIGLEVQGLHEPGRPTGIIGRLSCFLDKSRGPADWGLNRGQKI